MAKCAKCNTDLFQNRKERKNQKDCMDTCQSWFGANPVLKSSCCCACAQNANIRYGTKEDYLCGQYGPEERDLISVFGVDYCPGKGSSFNLENYYDPFGENERILQDDLQDSQFKRRIGYIILGVILMMVIVTVILKSR